MAKINVDADEFPNIVVAFLLYKLLHPDDVCSFNEEFNEYAEKLKLKGMKPLSLNYYLNMDSKYRIMYKRIKDTFDKDEHNKNAIIYIYPSKEAKKREEEGLLKKAIRKLMKKESITKEEEQIIKEEIFDG